MIVVVHSLLTLHRKQNNQLAKTNFNTKNDHAVNHFSAQQNHNAANKQAGNHNDNDAGYGHFYGLGKGKWRRDVDNEGFDFEVAAASRASTTTIRSRPSDYFVL